MINLEYVMTYRERIEGPLPSTAGSPFHERFCWKIVEGSGERRPDPSSRKKCRIFREQPYNKHP